ncbi:ester cyclase [Streptosporangium sp. NPDC000396]|uniref:nuclear transport factor 2 family protein n=1 Tax=Streptosporangium sp. NPDC000396 TaxID=3366185 RepID=UPI003696C682
MATGSRLESNKQIVLDFYQAAFNDKDFDAALRLVGQSYRQHNPLIADGPGGLRVRLDHLKDAFPALKVQVRRLIAEDDHVVAHVHAVRVPGQRGTAIIDIFKLENGKLVEHWDVLQEIPEDALNQNGMF